MEIQTQQSVQRLQANREVYTQATEFDGIKKAADNTYAMEVSFEGEEVSGYQPVARLDIDLTDTEEVASVLAMDSLPDVIREDIALASEQAMEDDNSSQSVTLFAPRSYFIDPEDMTNPIPPSEDLPEHIWESYYTYLGTQMVSVRAYYEDDTTKTHEVSRGAATKELAAEITDIVISGVLGNPVFAVAESGFSLLQMFLNLSDAGTADIIEGTSGDFIEAVVNYERTIQYTFAKSGNLWIHCLTTQQLYFESVEYRQVYYITVSEGHYKRDPQEYTVTYNETLKTAYYDSPWETAHSFIGNPLIMNVYFDVGNKSFKF